MIHNKKVTEEQIWEYIKCPTLYDTNFNKKIKEIPFIFNKNEIYDIESEFSYILDFLKNNEILKISKFFITKSSLYIYFFKDNLFYHVFFIKSKIKKVEINLLFILNILF